MKPIVLKIKTLSASERKMTAEILDCIREIEILKIHLEMGYPSVMEILVRECGYSETAALRRIDAARIVSAIPEFRTDLQSGSLNLSQVSIVAQSLRQKEKLGEKVSLDKKKEIVNAVKNKRTFEVQKIAAQMLDLPVVQVEKLKVQADASVRIEMRLSKSEMEILQKAKELLGHIRPGMSMKELVVLMAERIIKSKDPAREVRVDRKKENLSGGAAQMQENLLGKNHISINREWKNQIGNNSCSVSEFKTESSRIVNRVNPLGLFNPTKGGCTARNLRAATRVSAAVKRKVFQRDQGCQWKDPVSGNRCGSRNLLELDHQIPKWAGGSDETGNLELKCRAHNQWKYSREAGIRALFSLSLI